MMDVSLCAKLPWGSFLLFKRMKVNGRSSIFMKCVFKKVGFQHREGWMKLGTEEWSVRLGT